MLPKLNRRRALFVLSKIDEILAWEQGESMNGYPVRGTWAISLRGPCRAVLEAREPEVVDDFLERPFPESRRKAYYLVSIHEHLPKSVRHELKNVGWAKAAELVKVARSDGQRFESATWLHKAPEVRVIRNPSRHQHEQWFPYS
jgi:hypothetical protein